jgi:hypothetical protein
VVAGREEEPLQGVPKRRDRRLFGATTKPPKTTSVPLGQTFGDSSWTLRVNSVNRDAWPAVQAADPSNDPPPAGYRDVMASLTLTYNGSDAGDPIEFLNDISVVGPVTNQRVDSFSSNCGTLPGVNDGDLTELAPGESATFNECWQIAAGDVTGLVLRYDLWPNSVFVLH